MLLRVAGNRDLEIAHRLDAAHEVGRAVIAAGMRLVAGAYAALRVAAQGHDMPHARRPVAAQDVVDLGLRGAHASQVRGRPQGRLAHDASHGRVRPLPRRSAGPGGHRDEIRAERREPFAAAPERRLGFRGFRRKELEGHTDRRSWQTARAQSIGRGHATS